MTKQPRKEVIDVYVNLVPCQETRIASIHVARKTKIQICAGLNLEIIRY